MIDRRFVALRATLYASSFVLLWTWLAIEVSPLDLSIGGPLPAWVRVAGAEPVCGFDRRSSRYCRWLALA